MTRVEKRLSGTLRLTADDSLVEFVGKVEDGAEED
jgi:hypothetical protein